MIQKEYQFQNLNFKLKNADIARFRRDNYFLLADINKSILKYPDDIFKSLIDFLYPEIGNEVKPRFKELFETFLEGEVEKINYDIENDENNQNLINFAMEIISDFFAMRKS